ncbi:DUF938 domain-containing protein [Vibrio olivae]|uniref:DUF938 domain-containing protein n=1 Tax=Vibrio olivae TaxID=1243002 RepID=A0ABV5HIG7_9VIBR
MSKQFSEACERNKYPILTHLKSHFRTARRVLEIGSGTGQHAAHFATHLPHLVWHTSDMPNNHLSIRTYVREKALTNLVEPIEFTVGIDAWPLGDVDAVFTANTTHIMQPEEAKLMMESVQAALPVDGVFCQYGPMKIKGEFSGDSDREFDRQIRAQGFGGIRDLEQLVEWANGLRLEHVISMPANNFLLVWKK